MPNIKILYTRCGRLGKVVDWRSKQVDMSWVHVCVGQMKTMSICVALLYVQIQCTCKPQGCATCRGTDKVKCWPDKAQYVLAEWEESVTTEKMCCMRSIKYVWKNCVPIWSLENFCRSVSRMLSPISATFLIVCLKAHTIESINSLNWDGGIFISTVHVEQRKKHSERLWHDYVCTWTQ